MRLESAKVGRLHRRFASGAGLVAFVAMFVAIFVARVAGGFVAPQAVTSLTVGALMIAPLVALFGRLLATRAIFGGKGALTLEDDHLVVEGLLTRRIPLDRIEGAVVNPMQIGVASCLEIALRGGDVVLAALRYDTDANAFLQALDERGLQRSLPLRLRRPALSWVPMWTSSAAIGAALFLAMRLFLPFAGTHALMKVAVFALPIVGTWFFQNWLASPGVTVGSDGVTIVHATNARFVPYSSIAQQSNHAGRVRLHLRDGSSIDVGTGAPQATYGARTAIQRGLERWWQRTAATTLPLLERSNRTIDEWRDALRAMVAEEARGGSAYRGGLVTHDELSRVLEDAHAPAEQRIAAGLALASTTAEGAEPRARIRIAAAGCANEHLRVALEKLADGATDEAAIEDAITAEQKS